MNKIVIHEVGLRDGLQMEKGVVPPEKKISWARRLMNSGVDIIQIGSFVHPEKVPQMADTDMLFTELKKDKKGSVILSALVLNERGLERGFNCGVDMFCMGVSATETHSKKNTGMSTSEATGRIIAMALKAQDSGIPVQVSVQSAFGCGYEGFVPRERVLNIVQRYVDSGLKRISLADTAGHATPDDVEKMYESIFRISDSIEASCHFHNTYGMGMANAYSAMKAGVQNYESSVAGLGGCPFTKIAGGNLCTEDFIHMLQRMNIRGDIGIDELIGTAQDVAGFFGREMAGIVHKSGPIGISRQTQ